MSKSFALILALIAVCSVLLFLAHRWIPLPASQHAAILDKELHWALIDSGILFLSAQFVLAALIWRSKDQSRRVRPFHRGVPIAIWIATVFIALELFSTATLGRRSWGAMYDASITPQTLRVQAMGQQFAFYFRYPGPDGKFGPVHVDKIDPSIANYFGLNRTSDATSRDDVVTASSLILPVNRPVELLLLSQDVIHGFYVRELRIQQDMVPGMEIPVHFTATKIGKYEIVCTQLCGTGHYRMRAYLEVISESDFDKWMRAHER